MFGAQALGQTSIVKDNFSFSSPTILATRKTLIQNKFIRSDNKFSLYLYSPSGPLSLAHFSSYNYPLTTFVRFNSSAVSTAAAVALENIETRYPLVELNPSVARLKSDIVSSIPDLSPEVRTYVENLLTVSAQELAVIDTKEILSLPEVTLTLPSGFYGISKFKETSGIYHFKDKTGKGYVGSSANLFQRIYRVHRVNAFSKTNLHSLFYSNVVSQGWENFSLTLYLIPERCNHLSNFSKLNTEVKLTSLDKSILNKLSFYEITVIEQAFIQELDSSYNMQIYSNFGGIKNKGAKGLIRDEKFRESISLEHQGRIFSDYTKNQHRDNMKGKKTFY